MLTEMKFANVSWGWTPIPEDTPQGDSLIQISDQIRALGFEGIDYLATPEGLDEFFDEANSRKLGEHARAIGLLPNVFVFQSDVWNNPDGAVREQNLRYFETCAQVAKWVGCGIVSGLSPLPAGAAGWKFNPSASAQKQSFRLPEGYCFKQDWERLVDGYRSALSIAKSFGLRMSIECFPMSIISTPHAMLKVLEDVGDADFGIQLDTNHLVAQHIDPEWTIHMLGGKSIFNMHCKDNDGVSRGNIPAGCGITDYTVVISALKQVGYCGNLSVELEFTDNPRRYNKQALDHLRLCLAGEY
jgi:sugar phosphate isomerase/epimerase